MAFDKYVEKRWTDSVVFGPARFCRVAKMYKYITGYVRVIGLYNGVSWLEMIAFFVVHPYNNRKQKEKRPPKRSFGSTPVLSDEPTISKNLYLNS